MNTIMKRQTWNILNSPEWREEFPGSLSSVPAPSSTSWEKRRRRKGGTCCNPFSYFDQYINWFIFNWLQWRISFIDSGCKSFWLSTISTISPEAIRLSEISVPQTNSCIEWEFPQQQIIHPPNLYSLDIFHLSPFNQFTRILSTPIFVHPHDKNIWPSVGF